MELYSKDDINKANDKVYEIVPVPEWGNKSVRLASLTGTQRDDFEAKSMIQKKDGSRQTNLTNFRARLLALCMVDGSGGRVYSDVDVPLLGQKNASVLERLFDKAREMNGMSDDDVKEMTENFDSDQSESSTSD